MADTTATGSAAGSEAGSVEEILDLYQRFGPNRYDEDVSQLDHALQCAALAEAEGAPDPLVAAALLHDVGHLLHLRAGGVGPVGDLHHESVGAVYLDGLFGSEVTAPVAGHVQAKRYLCAVEPALQEELSAGSRASLVRQGGPMDNAQVAAFTADASHSAAVRLRRWDDAGKVEGLRVGDLDSYVPLLRRLARDSGP